MVLSLVIALAGLACNRAISLLRSLSELAKAFIYEGEVGQLLGLLTVRSNSPSLVLTTVYLGSLSAYSSVMVMSGSRGRTLYPSEIVS